MAVKLNVRMELPGKDPKEFVYEFDQAVITLGRDSKNDIQIPLTTVSRTHAKILKEGSDYFLEDLKSTHGTNHNGKPVGSGGKKLLRNGDRIELMHFQITFESEQDKPLAMGQAEKTEMLARRMVQEVLSSIGTTQENPYLRVMNGPEEGKRFELVEGVGEVVIGRATECDFAINDANISRRHALVRKDWAGITIEDLGSKNGVLVNEKRVEKAAPLKDSDEIALGAVKLVFIDPTASMLGKLDDLPVFQGDANPEEAAEEGDGEEDAEGEAQEDEGGGEEGEEHAEGGDEPAEEGEEPAEGGDEPAEGGEGDDAEPPEGGATDEPSEELPKTRGSTDYLLYAAIALVVLGMAAVGVVLATMI